MPAERDPNIYEPGQEIRGIAGYDSLRGRVGDAAGSARLGMSVWDLPAGQSAYPYHWHYVEEELVVVLEGTPLLRDARGWRRLERGAVVAFPAGADGGHQIHNDTDDLVRFVAISTSGEPDVVRYPDEGKLGVFERPPGEGRLWKFFPDGSDVPYDHGLARPDIPAEASELLPGARLN